MDALLTDRFFFAATGSAIHFLQRLDSDAAMAEQCSRMDLEGRLALAERAGYDFSEEDLRVAVRLWDHHGVWRKWLSEGRLEAHLDDLPTLAENYDVPAADIERYRANGHVLLRGLLSSEEVAAYRPVIRAAVNKFGAVSYRGMQLDARSFKEAGFTSVVNLRVWDEASSRFVLARRFARVAAQLMGVSRVRVYLDETFDKASGDSGTPWHQDRTYFPPDSDQLVTLWMPLVDCAAVMGTLSFASRSHLAGDLGYHPISPASQMHFTRVIDEAGFHVTPGADMAAGDATFHNGWTLHGACANRSGRTREAMTIVYYPDGTRLMQPTNPYQQRGIEHGYRAKPGDLAESSIHPLVHDDSWPQ